MIRLLLLLLLPTAILSAQPAGGFGTSSRLAFAFRGRIYYLPENTTYQLPDFSTMAPVGTIYSTRLDITPRDFETGFPGVTDRFEWFGIVYDAEFSVATAGLYHFSVLSDDGSRLYIDGHLVVDNDGVHAPSEQAGEIQLSSGRHSARVEYFQGPRTEVALVVKIAPGDQEYQIFDLEQWGTVETNRADGRTRYMLGAQALFDTDKATLLHAADSVLLEIVAAFQQLPSGAAMVIEGHTDDRASAAHNLALSTRRAQAVADWLVAHGIDRSRMTVQGKGESAPRVPNTSDENRARNRRVEITVSE